MPKSKFASPTLQLTITEEQYQRAVQSSSGGCLIADAIKEQYPHLSGIVVDMATVRCTDSDKGVRYTYLTPPLAQHILLAFDQGWTNPAEEVTIRRAVHIRPVMQHPASVRRAEERRQVRLAELEAKESSGEQMTAPEKQALTRMRKPRPPRPPSTKPTSEGPVEVKVIEGSSNHGVVVHGGRSPVSGPPHPNLLRGRSRLFGARLAEPGEAFKEAVERAVEERLAARDQTAIPLP